MTTFMLERYNSNNKLRLNCTEGVDYAKKHFIKEFTLQPSPSITIVAPGKLKKGDYKLFYNDIAPSHSDICCMLFDYVRNGKYNYVDLITLLEETYLIGTHFISNDEDIDNLNILLFWITLQEEINYPKKDYKQGTNLPFCRYFEAIIAAINPQKITIKEVIERCDNRNKAIPKLLDIDNPPSFYVLNKVKRKTFWDINK